MQVSTFFVSRTSFWLLVPVVRSVPCPGRHSAGLKKVCLMVAPFCIYLHTPPCFRDPWGELRTLWILSLFCLPWPLWILQTFLDLNVHTCWNWVWPVALLHLSKRPHSCCDILFTTAIALFICLGSWHSCSQFSSDKKSASHGPFHFSFPCFSIVSLHEFSCSCAITHLLMKWVLRSPIFRFLWVGK